MPSPIAHSLAGLAIGLVATAKVSATRSLVPRKVWPISLLLAACLAAAPDLDLLVRGYHRTVTHSVGATALVMIVTIAVTGQVTGRIQWRWVLAAGAAHASHVLLDWLGTDRFPPPGIEALWPFSHQFYVSGWNVFPPTERRLLIPGALAINLRAVVREILIMGPITALTWWITRTRRSRGRISSRDVPPQPSV